MDYLEVQRRNFEAQFGSLASLGYEDKLVADASDVDRDSANDSAEDENGIGSASDSDSSDGDSDRDSDEESEENSDEESDRDAAPKVVRLTENFTPVMVLKADKKLARSGRAPTLKEMEEMLRAQAKLTRKQAQRAAEEDLENLENDLKLQRLLSESHILAHNVEYSGADLTMQTLDYEAPVGNARRRILDQRIRAAAATNSSTKGLPKTLEKMPMHMRKGMIKARERRAVEYEREAREAGIVLSKVKKGELRNLDQGRGATALSDRLGVGKKQRQRVRNRGLKVNTVGRATPHGLRISKQEIERVNNQGKRRRRK